MSEHEMIRLREERIDRWSGHNLSHADSDNAYASLSELPPATLIAGTNKAVGSASPDVSSYLIEMAAPSRSSSEPKTASQPLAYPLKRAIDIVGSIAGLVLFAPLMIVVGMLLWALGGGPIIFAQDRIGFDGRKFRILKFRTMHANADTVLSGLLAANSQSSSEWLANQKLASDPRVTPLGRLLRLSSVDELPQLINVLKGDMSLVGPRPIVDSERVRYGSHFDRYCAVRPGMTGLWQVSGRNNTTYECRVAMDVMYAKRISLRLDLKILVLTIPAVLGAQGCS